MKWDENFSSKFEMICFDWAILQRMRCPIFLRRIYSKEKE